MNPTAQEKLYTEYFGPPVLIARGIVNTPPVTVFIFTNEDKSEYIHITQGMDNPGYRELIMITAKQERWPAYFIQALCRYQFQYKEQFAETETFDNANPIPECNDFTKALFLDTELFGMEKKEITRSLGLNKPPLYVFPITDNEFAYALKYNCDELLKKIAEKTDPIADISRQTAVVETDLLDKSIKKRQEPL